MHRWFLIGLIGRYPAASALPLTWHLFAKPSKRCCWSTGPSRTTTPFCATRSPEAALHAIGLLVSEEARRGKLPLSPAEWGQFLEYVATLPVDAQ